MKKRFMAGALVAVLVMAMLAGCKGSNPQGSTESGEKKIEPCTITYWSGDRHDMTYIEEWVQKFNKENKYGIKVESQYLTEDVATMFKLGWEGGTACDVLNVGNNAVTAYGGTYLVNLEEYAKTDQTYWKDMECETRKYAYKNWDPKTNEVFCYYGTMRTGSRVEYNKKQFEECGYKEIPKKLSDYIDMAIDIGKKGNGKFYGIAFPNNNPFGRICEQIAQASGYTYLYDFKEGKFKFDDYKPILQEFKRLFESGAVYPDETNVDNMRAIFAEEGFTLWQNPSQEVAVFTTQFPVTKFEWGVGILPSVDGEIHGATSSSPLKGMAINNKSEHKDAAWEFIKFMQSKECLIGYCESGFEAPFTTVVKENADMSHSGRLSEFVYENDEVYPTAPTINLTGQAYTAVFWDAIKGLVDIDAAIADCNKRYNEALEADIKSGDTLRVVIKDFDPMHPSAGTVEFWDH